MDKLGKIQGQREKLDEIKIFLKHNISECILCLAKLHVKGTVC